MGVGDKAELLLHLAEKLQTIVKLYSDWSKQAEGKHTMVEAIKLITDLKQYKPELQDALSIASYGNSIVDLNIYAARFRFVWKLNDFQEKLEVAALIAQAQQKTKALLCKKLCMSFDEFQRILNTALKRGLFDVKKHAESGTLTSNGIKKRAEVVLIKRANMRAAYKRKVSDAKKGEETPSETPQSKEKESREKESRESSGNRKKLSMLVLMHNGDFYLHCADTVGFAAPLKLSCSNGLTSIGKETKCWYQSEN